MISPALLERPGAWRRIGLATGLLVALAPPASLLLPRVAEGQFLDLGGGFLIAISRSIGVGAAACILGLAAGLPVGLLAGLYTFPLRRVFLAVLALPLVIPSFLWAIGLSSLRIGMGLDADSLLSGASGCVLAFGAFTTPLVALATYLAVSGLPQTQVDAARVAGGEFVVLRYASRAVLPVATVVALLGGVVTLSDPGPGQILGFRGVASEVLVSFAALYDFDLAARQCLILGAVVLIWTVPVLVYSTHSLAHSLLARSPDPVRPVRWSTASWAGPFLSASVIGGTLAAPVLGLSLPALERLQWAPTLETVGRTAANTFAYGLLAGLVAGSLGFGLGLCAGRERSLRSILLAGLVIVFVLPPALGALGTIYVASYAPPWLDPILRSRLTVGAVLGLRLVPIPAVLAVRTIGQMPPSWALAASTHGVPMRLYAARVLVPFLASTFGLAVAVVALLATADVGTVLLLQPPGESSLPVSIFTVMANAPESLVASLCLAYVAIAAATLGLGGLVVRVFGASRSSKPHRQAAVLC